MQSALDTHERPHARAGIGGAPAHGRDRTPVGLRIARNIDLVLLALALALFLATGLPLKGWAIGAGAWIVQRLVRDLLTRQAERSEDVRARVGYIAASMIGRGWLAAGIIFGFGLSDNDAGLAGAVLFLAVFTIFFTTAIILRPFEDDPKATP